ncbi:MAG TPA: hypothetical protein VGZ73_02345 [Bryobacteraceae bacterium]|nr:hypothetical protein [Bryobacteraceae bacterium]
MRPEAELSKAFGEENDALVTPLSDEPSTPTGVVLSNFQSPFTFPQVNLSSWRIPVTPTVMGAESAWIQDSEGDPEIHRLLGWIAGTSDSKVDILK